MAKAKPNSSTRQEAKHAAQMVKHWSTGAAEYRSLARGPERSMYRRAAEQAAAIARSFERARANRFCSDFALTVDGEPGPCRIGRPGAWRPEASRIVA
jgi:hypothetical protein